MCTQSVVIKKGENVGTYFDEDVREDQIHLELLHMTNQESDMIKMCQEELIECGLYMWNSM